MHVLVDGTPRGGGFSGAQFNEKKEEIQFEIIHIPDRRGTTEPLTYRERGLHVYAPQKYDNKKPHLDPDFDNLTYGEPSDANKAAILRNLNIGEYVFFAASLALAPREGFEDRSLAGIRRRQTGQMAKYLVGYFQVQCLHEVERLGLLEPRITPEDSCLDQESRLRKNAHFRTLDSHDFVCIVGQRDRRSARLDEAVRFTNFGSPFNPTPWGIRFQGPKGFPRGVKKLTEDQVEVGLSRLRPLTQPSAN